MKQGSKTGSGGVHICQNGNGAQFAKIIPRKAAAGIISLMIKLVLEPIVGVKMVCLESPTVVHIRQLHAVPPLLRACAVERKGSNSERKTLRPDGTGVYGIPLENLPRDPHRYFYLDSTPTHSYMRALYKYPQAEYPYLRLIEENRKRDRYQREFELEDTGIFDEGRYFDVFAEYAKAEPDGIHASRAR